MMKTIIKIIVVLILSVQTISAGRYYDSETSRFLAVDPKADKYPGLTSYNYCINNPLNNIDPDGKEPITVGGTAIATGTAYVAGAIALAATIHTYKIVTDPIKDRTGNPHLPINSR